MHKLAIVISSLGPGGAERIAVMQAAWFTGLGFDVTLITLDGSVKDHYDTGSDVARVRMQDNSPQLLFDYVQEQGFDLTIDHIHWDEVHFDFFGLMGESKYRLVIFDHSTYFYPLYLQSKWSLFENRVAAYRNADAVSVLSRHTCQMFRQNIPATVFIPNPLSYESAAVAPVLESKNIIAVANWQRPEKRLDRILKIFSDVSVKVKESKLILVGPVNQFELHDLLNHYHLDQERIEVVGQKDDVESCYLRSRVFLHTSEMEGFGLVLTEAGMHGLPRVVMHSPGMDEVIEHGVDGYLVEQGDEQTAVDHLLLLLSDDQLCQFMSANALTSTQRFSLERIGERWEWLADLVTGTSSTVELEAAISQDCGEQGVDEISSQRISQDYDTELMRIIRSLQGNGLTATFSLESLQQFGVESTRSFKSRTAKVLSDVSELFESRHIAKLVRQSGLFDQLWYTEQYPDVASSRIDPALHYTKFGAMEGRNPSDSFDTLYYLSKHRDLVFKKENPLLHFLETKAPDTQAPSMNPGSSVRQLTSFRKKQSRTELDQKWLNKFNINNNILTILEPNYLGIRRSASQFVRPEQMLFLKEDLDDNAIDNYVRLIVEAAPEKILIQGFPRSYLSLVRKVRKEIPNTPVFCIYHGPFTQLRVPGERKCLQNLIELYREGVLDRIGLVKEGMAETLRTIGIDARFVMNFIANPPKPVTQTNDVSIGIVGSEWQPLKPLYHQIAACKHISYDEVRIVGSDKPIVEFCELFDIKATHIAVLLQNDMLAFLAKNTINLYVTLSECAPMLPLESLAEGVPCLFGPNNHYFCDHPYLHSRLVVDVPDSETRIAKFARVAIEERQNIMSQYREYAKNYNIRAMKSFEAFLEN
jgi:glycosyltransferase involved in cell wall biosynthesis